MGDAIFSKLILTVSLQLSRTPSRDVFERLLSYPLKFLQNYLPNTQRVVGSGTVVERLCFFQLRHLLKKVQSSLLFPFRMLMLSIANLLAFTSGNASRKFQKYTNRIWRPKRIAWDMETNRKIDPCRRNVQAGWPKSKVRSTEIQFSIKWLS